MKQEDIIRMAREAGLHLATDVNWMPIINLAYAEKFAELVRADAFEQGRQEGMKQERALWELTKLGQEIEAQPAQRPWVGLTFEERNEIWRKEIGWGDPSHNDEDLMKTIEAKLKEKNT